jgi:dTDP-4-dehydrorhamnose reductase
MESAKILILGASGMLGHKLFLHLSGCKNFQVFATARNPGDWLQVFPRNLSDHIRFGVDAYEFSTVIEAIDETRPDLVINCIGIIKQGDLGQDSRANIAVNALLPHEAAQICRSVGARFLHLSTDCVFSGKKGGYQESDIPDASDLYGRSKLLGEVDYPHCLTLRTSIIGHELQSQLGLIEWFLAQKNPVRGYTRHVFTGFPTIELAKIIARYIIPNPSLSGVYHLSSDPISKYDLLKLVAQVYHKDIKIEPYDETVCDRSLDAAKLRNLVAFDHPAWPEMIQEMYQDSLSTPYPRKH